jgi:hypothetical protein
MEMSIHIDPVSSVFFRNAFTEACFQPANVKNDAGTIIDSEALGGQNTAAGFRRQAYKEREQGRRASNGVVR